MMEKPIESEMLGDNTIVVSENLTKVIVQDLLEKSAKKCHVFAIITDTNVGSLYSKDFIDAFVEVGNVQFVENVKVPAHSDPIPSPKLIRFIIPPGEMSKSREMKSKIEDFLFEHGCNSDTCIIALGGGVVGDLAGFIASTFNRGVPLVQIPTTLLAMVDSSIGGKNGVDTVHGKNLIGTFWRPIRTYIDTQYLLTLNKREFANGMAEVIKASILDNEEEFKYLEDYGQELMNFMDKSKRSWHDAPNVRKILLKIIHSAIRLKVDCISTDLRDNGKRQLLNFGHTIGHALEISLTPQILHGECVAIGMIIEMEISIGMGVGNPTVLKRLKNLLKVFQLPISIGDEVIAPYIDDKKPITIEGTMKAMKLDKKNIGGAIRMILMKDFGVSADSKATPVDEADILKSLNTAIGNVSILGSVPHQAVDDTKSIIIIGPVSGLKRSTGLAAALSKKFNWSFLAVTSTAVDTILQHNPNQCIIHLEIIEDDSLGALKRWMQNGGVAIQIISDCVKTSEMQFYEEYSNYTFFDENEDIESLVHLVHFAQGKKFDTALPSCELFRSFFLCLPLPDVTAYVDDLPLMVSGTHAVELRIDHLIRNFVAYDKESFIEFKCFIARQISLIRSKIKNLPIIYTIRTKMEAGRIPDDIDKAYLLQLYLFGIRIGCEIIDVQMNMPQEVIKKPMKEASRGKCRIIASYHRIHEPLDWTGPETCHYIQQGLKYGDVIKLVSVANSKADNRKVEEFSDKYYSSNPSIPLIALNMGKVGQLSRLTNRYFTPVTHPMLITDSRLSQLSCTQIIQGLSIMGQIEPKCFYLFGHPIGHSISPLIHRTIFEYFGFPHTYQLFDTLDLAEVEKIIRNHDFFGGASVRMPHKIEMIRLIDSVTSSVQKIGAANTIIKKRNGLLEGENTDWLGIRNCLDRALKWHKSNKTSVALVLGGGGTARAAIYALASSNFTRIYLYNRTFSKLSELVQSFPEIDMICLQDLSDVETLADPPFVIVDTTPWNSSICTNSFVNRTFIQHNRKGVLVKLAYGGITFAKPLSSPDIEDAIHPGVTTITGLDILIEQALWQSYLWTGLMPDFKFVKESVMTKLKLLD